MDQSNAAVPHRSAVSGSVTAAGFWPWIRCGGQPQHAVGDGADPDASSHRIGGGMIFRGRLYRGVDRSHPEIGHHVIDASGPACMCGFHGCWESLAAGPAMSNWMEEQMGTNRASHRNLTAKQICEMAGAGHA